MEATECQYHGNCGGYCETDEQVANALCEDCMQSEREQEADAAELANLRIEVAALRARLEQPVAQPEHPTGGIEQLAAAQVISIGDLEGRVTWLPHHGEPIKVGSSLYTHQQPERVVQGEPVYQCQAVGDGRWTDQTRESYEYNARHASDKIRVLYTRPQPERVALTDDEIWKNDEIMAANSGYGANFETLREVIRAIEAAHGIKGG